MTPTLEKIAAEAAQENTSERLVLIDDIVRAKKLLWAMGKTQHNEFLTPSAAGKLFDTLYDYDHEQLTLIRDKYSKQLETLVKEKI